MEATNEHGFLGSKKRDTLKKKSSCFARQGAAGKAQSS